MIWVHVTLIIVTTTITNIIHSNILLIQYAIYYTQFIVSLILQSSCAKLLTNNKNIKKYMRIERHTNVVFLVFILCLQIKIFNHYNKLSVEKAAQYTQDNFYHHDKFFHQFYYSIQHSICAYNV